jgi:hypothetical protein
VASLRAAATAGRIDPPIVIVVEGRARAGAPEGTAGGVTVVHAPASGDDELVRQATGATARQEPQVQVVTADRVLRHRLEAVGANVVGPSWLLPQLEQP